MTTDQSPTAPSTPFSPTGALTGLSGKVAVVTGAGRMRSIGRPIAVELARAGCKVVLTGRGRPQSTFPQDEIDAGWRDIDSVVDEIRAIGGTALGVVSDVGDENEVAKLRDRVLQEFGRVDIVVNNAGSARGADRVPVIDLDTYDWTRVIHVNLTGTFFMCRAFGKVMVESGRGGSIINISSIAGKRFSPNVAVYGASKAGIQALTASMARETGPFGVRVNAICPGFVETSRLDDIIHEDNWPQFVKDNIPLGRPGTGEDIANLTMFLCSDQGSWVNGQSWNIDGGTVVEH